METKYIILLVAFSVLVVYVLASIWLHGLKFPKKEKKEEKPKEKKSRKISFGSKKPKRIHAVRIKKDKKKVDEAKVEHVYQASAEPIKLEELEKQTEESAQKQEEEKPKISEVVKQEREAAQQKRSSDAYVTDFDELIARQRARRAEVARQREEMRKYFENRNGGSRVGGYTPLQPTVQSSLDVVEESVEPHVSPFFNNASKPMSRADYEKVLMERRWGTDYSKFNQQTSSVENTDNLAENMIIGEVVAHAKSKTKKKTYYH